MEEFALFTWTLFVLPVAWLWILAIGFFILEMTCIANEKWGFAIVLSIVAFLGIQFCTEYSPLLWVVQNPGWFGIGALGYIVAGALYSIVAWSLKLANARDKYKEKQAEFLADRGSDPTARVVPVEHRRKWREIITSYSYADINPEELVVRKNKAWLTWRIAFWPLAGIWTLLNDPIRRVAIFVRRRLTAIYEGIYVKLTGSMNESIQVPDEDKTVGAGRD